MALFDVFVRPLTPSPLVTLAKLYFDSRDNAHHKNIISQPLRPLVPIKRKILIHAETKRRVLGFVIVSGSIPFKRDCQHR